MEALLARYLAKPTSANARRIAKYYRDHAVRPLTLLERGLLRQAMHHARLL